MNKEMTFVEDLTLCRACKEITSATAQKAVRALCRYYGGQMVYIPARENAGDGLLGVMADAVGDEAAEKILSRIRRFYGGASVYFPLERGAFRKTVALEIYNKCGTGGVTANDLAREYGISFAQVYRLWREGRRETLEKSLPYLTFLELTQ
jgi:Mor family transcriptional regulator